VESRNGPDSAQVGLIRFSSIPFDGFLGLSRLIRGAYRDRHGRGARDAVDATASGAREVKSQVARQTRERLAPRKTSDVVADGEVVWSWHQLLMLSRVEAYSAQPVSDAPFNPRGDGDKKELVAGESTKEAVKTIRAGKAG
jgi:hypothetical protein